MKYCTHCGAQLPDDAQFCPGCGKAAGTGASPAPARKFPLPVLLAILAVALVVGVVFALTQGGDSREAPGAPRGLLLLGLLCIASMHPPCIASMHRHIRRMRCFYQLGRQGFLQLLPGKYRN